MGERSVRIREVMGSNPTVSTKKKRTPQSGVLFFLDRMSGGFEVYAPWVNPTVSTKNPECVSVRDFYFLLFHYSLFTWPRIRDFWKVKSHSEQ